MQTITIRHSGAADAEAIRNIYACPKVFAGTLQQPYPSLALWQQRLAESQPGSYSLVAELEGAVVGQLGLKVCPSPRRKHVGSFGMGVLERYQGQGIGGRLLAAAIDMADNWLNLSRLELEVFTDNQPAIALYQKYGFVIEGESAQFAFRNGEYVDVYHMARLRR
ncbi:GNAT family N-acetyltransferase [Paludibacterium purpuratum]|uniref:Putative acetyltransferase n=1 Tax=Paludibacterium purpuratum TaxID=1144873 RepID=A0A4R7B126_9NEIS|nr:GNAT family N-acetyltransferase [Paludibacterium purpuratum]TDR73295.1 putative acetyltransferase [Paludibacterium purpuratum]